MAGSLAACASATAPEPDDFGAHYRIEPVPAPVLDADSLRVTVSYGGCGRDREFELRHRLDPGGHAAVWLRKVTPNEPCDLFVTERRAFAVPEAVASAAAVMLLGPENETYQLRPD